MILHDFCLTGEALKPSLHLRCNAILHSFQLHYSLIVFSFLRQLQSYCAVFADTAVAVNTLILLSQSGGVNQFCAVRLSVSAFHVAFNCNTVECTAVS